MMSYIKNRSIMQSSIDMHIIITIQIFLVAFILKHIITFNIIVHFHSIETPHLDKFSCL